MRLFVVLLLSSNAFTVDAWAGRPRVFVADPVAPDGAPLSKREPVYYAGHVMGAVAETFRCADVVPVAESTDYRVTSTAYEDGDEFSVELSLYDLRRDLLVATASGSVAKDDPNLDARRDHVRTLVEELADEYALCQVVGTITVTREVDEDAREEELPRFQSRHLGVGTQAVVHERRQSSVEVWTFDVTGTHTKLDAELTIRGSGMSLERNEIDWTETTCYRDDGASEYPATLAEVELIEKRWALGAPPTIPTELATPSTTAAPAPQLSLTFDRTRGTYRLSIDATAIGTESGHHLYRTTGTCGTVEAHEIGTPYADLPHLAALHVRVPPMAGRRSDTSLSRRYYEISEDQSVRLTVDWDLRMDVPNPR
jgi:hypothetical protein